MMIWEAIVMAHLTQKKGLFVIPQFDIAWDRTTKSGGRCPDFLALDPNEPRLIYIIEVSEAYNLASLNQRFVERELHWYGPINRSFSFWGHQGPFKFKSLAYVRSDAVGFKCKADDVERVNLDRENIAFHWRS